MSDLEESKSLREERKPDVSTSSSNDGTTSSNDATKLSKSKSLKHYYDKQNEIRRQYSRDSEQIEAARRSKEHQRELRLSESDGGMSESGGPMSSFHVSDATNLSKDSLLARHEASVNAEKKLEKAAGRLANITLLVNFTLMVAKVTAAWLSGSMSIISSMIDSLVDLTSGALLSISSRLIRKRDPYQYPRGRTRVEPLTLILISTIMGIASLMLIINSVERITAAAFNGVKEEINVSWPTVAIMLTTIAVKLTLYFICKGYKTNSSIRVLSQDHRNDCISNSVALACAWLAYYFDDGVSLFGLCPTGGCDLYYLDPIGAIVVSFYILYTWMRTGYTHFVMLSGKSASPELINRIIHQCMKHDERITHIDTVYVYHYGTKFLVEVHIVLDQNMILKDTHDIAESLQTGIEALPEIERAFVHCDYEFEHHPHDEHKSV
ncbi:unnamed protein product [Caenorhabditis sp. 36 PRJEB53466]|nr:unnamed protein product [Caenorhabditis sp. 36 PRJEB53466]